MRRIVSVAPALVVLIVAVVTLAAAPTAIRSLQSAQTHARVALAQQRLDDNDVLERVSDAVADLAEVVEPGVVHIDAFTARRGRRGVPVPNGPVSSGSGWVFDDQGHIITNAHVIRGADVYTVQFSDGYTVRAEVVGLDTPTDVGVLKVDADAGLLPLKRASGERLRQGQRVFAFGSPFGFRFSMSEGIVSALGRNANGVTGRNGYTNFIQTDAAVNPGNSGGPLIDVHGRVIGMNTAIVTADNPSATVERQGQSAGIGFAIPLDTIESVAGQIIETGVVVKGFLGVSLTDADRLVLPEGSLPEGFRGGGVLVTGLVEGQPAARAGLQTGDIIIAVNGERVPDNAVLRAKIGSTRPGTTVMLRVVRGREGGFDELDIPVEIGSAIVSARNELIAVPEGQEPGEILAREQADIERVKDALGALARAGIPDVNVRSGEVTLMVREDSPAAAIGLHHGDVVLQINGREIKGADEFIAAVADAMEGRDGLALLVRDSSDLTRTVTLPLERP